MDKQGDQRLPHDSGRDVSLEELKRVGVLYSHHPSLETVDELAASRNYKVRPSPNHVYITFLMHWQNRDQVTISPSAMGEIYEAKVKSFFSEHMHEDEEIRYIRDGKGYFDVRNEGDDWIRILLEKDDLIILPAGIYHRFTTADDDVSTPGFQDERRIRGSSLHSGGKEFEVGGDQKETIGANRDSVHCRNALIQGGAKVDTTEQRARGG